MDLKALMQKLETINTKQIVTESVETKKVITESVARRVVKESADPVFTSSIARGLVEQFGYALDEAEGTSPWASDPAKDAAWKALSPEDQKWLGGADPTDKFILARAPNKGKPVAAPATSAATGVGNPGEEAAAQAAADKAAAPTAADQEDADLGAAMRANAAGGNSTSAATGVGNPGEEAAAQAAGQAASPAAPAAPAKVPAGINPETGEKYDSVANAPLQLPPGAAPEAGMTVAGDKSKPAGGQAASPAKPGFKADPLGQSIANQLKMTTPDAIKLFQKNNGLQADGMIGPATTKALQAAAQKMGLTVASGVGTSTAGAGRGGQGGPTATQMAQAPAAGGQAASPAANPKTADIDAQLAKYKKYPQSNAQIIARLEKEKAALTGGTTQTPAQQAVAKDIGNFAGESISYAEDQTLLRIKSLAGL